MKINILEWNITYSELMEWVAVNDIMLHAINGYGSGASTVYQFYSEEDYIAFRLKFAKERTHYDDFFDTGDPDSNYF
jgi:hypothetical protein